MTDHYALIEAARAAGYEISMVRDGGVISWAGTEPDGPTLAAIEADAAALTAAALQSEARRLSVLVAAGDAETRLGVVADAAGMALVELARLSQGLAAATTLAEVRAAAQPLADLTSSYIAQIDAGTLRLPHAAKGSQTEVLDAIGASATAVHDALAS
jgi:hypothetical protein